MIPVFLQIRYEKTMIGNWEDQNKSDTERYLNFAYAYCSASKDVCTRMIQDEKERSWTNANVVMMLAAHSVELFLKAALISRGKTKVWGHSLGDLYKDYKKKFPANTFDFDYIFQVVHLGFAEGEETKLSKVDSPSIMFRYPLQKNMVEWSGIHSFDPTTFVKKLSELSASYRRIATSIVRS